MLRPDEDTPFVSEKMSEPAEKLNELGMEDLIRFLEGPAEVFLKERLGMSPEEEAATDACEPLQLGGLEKYVIKDRLLGIALDLRRRQTFMNWRKQRRPSTGEFGEGLV